MTESDDSSRSRPNTGGAQARTKAEDLRRRPAVPSNWQTPSLIRKPAAP